MDAAWVSAGHGGPRWQSSAGQWRGVSAVGVSANLCGPVGSGTSGRAALAGCLPAVVGAVLTAATTRSRRGRRTRRADGAVEVTIAGYDDLRPAAEIAVRSLRWTKGWLDQPNFSEADYALLASNEEGSYRDLYLSSASGSESVFLVAKLDDATVGAGGEVPLPAGGWSLSSLLGLGTGSRAASPRVVGCVGCNVKCFRRLSGEEVQTSMYDGGESTVLRPVMADLAVAATCRGRGVASAMVAELEAKVLKEWGYEELVLLVEATNFKARSLYSRLGYRLSGVMLSTPTTYLETDDGPSCIKERRTVALLLRKSLRPFPIGAIENANWGGLAGIVAASALAREAIQSGQWSPLSALPWLASWLPSSS